MQGEHDVREGHVLIHRLRRSERELAAKELSAAKEAASGEAAALRDELQAAARNSAEQLQVARAKAAQAAATLSAELETVRAKLQEDAAIAEKALSAKLDASRNQLQDSIAAARVLVEDAARRAAQVAEAREALAGAESQLEDVAAHSARLAAELEAARGEVRDRGAAEGSSDELLASQEVVAQQACSPVTLSLTSSKLNTIRWREPSKPAVMHYCSFHFGWQTRHCSDHMSPSFRGRQGC